MVLHTNRWPEPVLRWRRLCSIKHGGGLLQPYRSLGLRKVVMQGIQFTSDKQTSCFVLPEIISLGVIWKINVAAIRSVRYTLCLGIYGTDYNRGSAARGTGSIRRGLWDMLLLT